MIAMDTDKLTAATIAARLNAAGPGALASCICARAGAGERAAGSAPSRVVMSRGISRMAPINSRAISQIAEQRQPVHGRDKGRTAPTAINTLPGHGEPRRSNACASSPALSARAGWVRATSSAGIRLPSSATATPSVKNTAERNRLQPRRRGDAAKVAGTQVRANEAQPRVGQQVSQRDAGGGPDHAEHRRLRQGAAPPRHRESRPARATARAGRAGAPPSGPGWRRPAARR